MRVAKTMNSVPLVRQLCHSHSGVWTELTRTGTDGSLPTLSNQAHCWSKPAFQPFMVVPSSHVVLKGPTERKVSSRSVNLPYSGKARKRARRRGVGKGDMGSLFALWRPAISRELRLCLRYNSIVPTWGRGVAYN